MRSINKIILIPALLFATTISDIAAQDTATAAHAEYVLREVINCYKRDSINRYLRMLYTIDDDLKRTSTATNNKLDSVKFSPRWRESYLRAKSSEQRNNVSSYQEMEVAGINQGFSWSNMAVLGVTFVPPSDLFKSDAPGEVYYAAEIMLRDDATNQLYVLHLTAKFAGRQLWDVFYGYFDKGLPQGTGQDNVVIDSYVEVVTDEEDVSTGTADAVVTTYRAPYQKDTMLLVVRKMPSQRRLFSFAMKLTSPEIPLTPIEYALSDQYTDPNGNTWCMYHLDDDIHVYILDAAGTVTHKLLFRPE